MKYQVQIVGMEMDRKCSNGSRLYNGQALIEGEEVNFTVRSRSQVHVDEPGYVDYACLDESQCLGYAFPIKPETLKFPRNFQSNGKGEAIIEEFRRQFDKRRLESLVEEE